MTRFAALLALAALTGPIAVPVAAKDSLGVYSNWAAFKDASPARCYAIAKPSSASDSGPFASVASWPDQNIRTQIHIRLSRAIREESDVTLRVGGKSFTLAASGHNAWAQDARMDAAVIAAMRSAPRMTVSARASNGNRFSDRYDLAGVATAIDAAVVGCANWR
jgi:hypothetical protein